MESERTLFVAGAFLARNVAFYASNALYLTLVYRTDRTNRTHLPAQQWKIQPTSQWPSPARQWQVSMDRIMGTAFEPLVWRYMVYPLFARMGILGSHRALARNTNTYTNTYSLPRSWTTFFAQLWYYQVSCEFLFYWIHRAFHTKTLYGWVHKKHHEFYAPCVVVTEHASVTEALLAGIVPSVLPALVLHGAFKRHAPFHLSVYCAFLFLHTWLACEAHSGYAWPWSLSNLVSRFAFWCSFTDAKHYDAHHERLSGNYGSPLFDWLFGTNVRDLKSVSTGLR